MDDKKLKPCPFCGGEAKFDHDDNGWNWIYCTACDASTNAKVSAMDDCRPLLVEQWNRRAAADAEAVAEQPVAILHDDGYWTFHKSAPDIGYLSQHAGWRMEVYTRPQPANVGVLVEALRKIARQPQCRVKECAEIAETALAEWEAK